METENNFAFAKIELQVNLGVFKRRNIALLSVDPV
jgi:hypothetical protein